MYILVYISGATGYVNVSISISSVRTIYFNNTPCLWSSGSLLSSLLPLSATYYPLDFGSVAFF